jgi:hypothetical protein
MFQITVPRSTIVVPKHKPYFARQSISIINFDGWKKKNKPIILFCFKDLNVTMIKKMIRNGVEFK